MGPVLFLLIGGTHNYFTILFSCWFSITTIKHAIVSNQKERKWQSTPTIFINWGSFTNREKRLYNCSNIHLSMEENLQLYDNMWISKKNKLSSGNYPLVIKGLEAPTVSMGLSQNLHGLAEGHTPSVAALIERSKCRLLQGWFIMGTGSGGSSPICRIS